MSRTILSVDDDPDFVVLYRYAMAHLVEPQWLIQVNTKEEAVAAYRRHRPAAILVDASMPVPLDTVPLIAELREAGFRGPLIAHSVDDRLNDELVAAGCDEACTKFDVLRLEALLARALVCQGEHDPRPVRKWIDGGKRVWVHECRQCHQPCEPPGA